MLKTLRITHMMIAQTVHLRLVEQRLLWKLLWIYCVSISFSISSFRRWLMILPTQPIKLVGRQSAESIFPLPSITIPPI